MLLNNLYFVNDNESCNNFRIIILGMPWLLKNITNKMINCEDIIFIYIAIYDIYSEKQICFRFKYKMSILRTFRPIDDNAQANSY